MGQGTAHSYLHPADINGKDSGEKQHLKEEVRHQAHNGEETELLELEQREHDDIMAQTLRSSSLPASTSESVGQWRAEPSQEIKRCCCVLTLRVAEEQAAVPAATPSLPTRRQQRHSPPPPPQEGGKGRCSPYTFQPP